MSRTTDPLTMARPMKVELWTLVNVTHSFVDRPQPACGLMEPHNFHEHEWMNRHFKMFSRWCDGICEWCFRDRVCENVHDGRERGLHGNGAHK